MATNQGSASLAERADIHKSCKSLETLLNVLNDYCEAAGATVILQKKLAKALRETAGMKTTGEIAGNAMNASALIFETSSDIDSKFAKIADKEYDSISGEVKKWFKKLAKEEKAHDERMANANARIKQAGQVYEKKSKKNPRDATEEHARYINLISTIGPEISQEKYNHALNVTQRHSLTTYSAAACLSRVADAEWLRTCEGVRRFSPTIGQLGEWRALCEGGWSGPVPQDLVDPDESQQPQPDREVINERRVEDEDRQAPTTNRNIEARDSRESTEQTRPALGYSFATESEPSREYPSSTRNSPTTQRTANRPNAPPSTEEHHASAAPSSYEPPRPFSERNNTDSVRSLSAFPLPPTHFPIPPPRAQQSSYSQSSQASSTHLNTSSMPRLTESPLPEGDDDDVNHSLASPNSFNDTASPVSVPPSPGERFQRQSDNAGTSQPFLSEDKDIGRPLPARSQTLLPTTSEHSRDTETSASTGGNSQPFVPYQKSDYFDTDREFGVNTGYTSKARTMDPVRTQKVERSDTGGSSGSVVAAMRNRYSSMPGITSPTPREVPSLPLSVNDLASRYQPMDGPSSPRHRTSSASIPRQLPIAPIDTGTSRQRDIYEDRVISAGNLASPPPRAMSPREEEAARRRQQRINDLAQLEIKEKELELRERERDIESRTRELQRDRARLTDVREGDEDTYPNTNPASRGPITPQAQPQLRPRERKTSFRTQRPSSQLYVAPASPPASANHLARPQSQYSYSTSNLVPSANSAQTSHSYEGQSSQHSHHSNATSSPSSSQSPHAPYCGCETCSAAKYRMSPGPSQPLDLRPPTKPITLRPEKSKPSWMRRLSMPVGNAFSSESKKGISNIAGVGNGGQGKSGIFGLDSKKNVSSTTLQSGIQGDGRRSYEASGINNRSVTNLGRR